jgi:hypothetical protein
MRKSLQGRVSTLFDLTGQLSPVQVEIAVKNLERYKLPETDKI